MKRLFWVASFLVVFGLIGSIPASADNLYASIRGTVTDPTGAVQAQMDILNRRIDELRELLLSAERPTAQ